MFSFFRALSALIGITLWLHSSLHGQILINGSTTNWTPILPGNGNQSDYFNDAQSGNAETEIVGNNANPGFFVQFYNGGDDTSRTDGQLGFRIRLSGEHASAGYNRYAFVGMDLNNDKALDMFVLVSQEDDISLLDAGTDLNNSPSTTDLNGVINRPVSGTYLYTSVAGTNFSWSAVTPGTNAPLASPTNIDAAGGTDHFLSFLIPFADLAEAAGQIGIAGFNDLSTVRYVMVTSQQANSLNSDLNGFQGAFANSTLTWEDLGGLSGPVNMDGSLADAIPEPSSFLLVSSGLLLLTGIRRRTK